jgi:hypothetical protein
MSVVLWKKNEDGEAEWGKFEPHEYKARLNEGWVIDPEDLKEKVEPKKEPPKTKKKPKVKYDNKD